MLPIFSDLILTKDVTGLDKYTKYEFQVLAFTSVGDGKKSLVKDVRTKEDGKILQNSSVLLTATHVRVPANWVKATNQMTV